MNPGFTHKQIYLQKFNSGAYLETYYSNPEGAWLSENHLCHVLKQLHETFTSGAVNGDTLIEIGSGPTIHTLLSACEVFKELIATDYCDQNRKEIEKWWKKEPGAFDWSPIVRHVCELEGLREKCFEKEEKLRQTLKQVLKCDVTKSNPLEPLVLPAADCLLTSLCLEAACESHSVYRAALKNIVSLLKIGGHLVMMGVLEETFYMVDHTKFSCLLYDMEFVKKAVYDSGCVIDDLQMTHSPENTTYLLSDYKGFFFLVAHKERNV